jgi:hypothetical protein
MALSSVKILAYGHLGAMKANLIQVAHGTTYSAGGDALTAADCGLSQIIAVFSTEGAADGGTSAVDPRYDATNKKLQLFGSKGTAGDQAESGSANRTTFTSVLLVVGH